MNQASGIEAPAGSGAWGPPDRRRVLQLALATIWLIDAVLQLQPFMFTRSFGDLMLGPTAQGNPRVIADPITHVSGSIAHHAVGANAAFVLIQLFIAIAIANRRTVRVGLATSIVWSLMIWWLGEGLGGVLTNAASPITGAPGAVIIYGALAILLWPTDDAGSPFTAERPVGAIASRVLWVVLWGSLGAIALFESINRHPTLLLGGLDQGEPAWLVELNRHVLSLVGGQGALLSAMVGAALLVVAVGILLPRPLARACVVLAVVVSVLVWVAGEDLGTLFTGSATDPNTGPLLVVLAVAYWPLRRAGAPAPAAPLHELVRA